MDAVYPAREYDDEGELIIFSDIEPFDNGQIVVTIKLTDGSTDLRDWHPKDASYAKEWAEEISYCGDVESTCYQNSITNEEIKYATDEVPFDLERPDQVRVATCIGCGCLDDKACVDASNTPCHWLKVDREYGDGVCSECPDHLIEWEKLIETRYGSEE